MERAQEAALLKRLKEMPAASLVIVNRTLLDTFRATSARNIIFFTAILTVFAAVIAVGVVYNNARIQLAAVKSEAAAKSEWAKMQKAHVSPATQIDSTRQRIRSMPAQERPPQSR